MEAYQVVQSRGRETIAVINEHVPSLAVGGITAASFVSPVENLTTTAGGRDSALVNFDGAVNAEKYRGGFERECAGAVRGGPDGENPHAHSE